MDDGIWAYAFSSSQYVQEAVANVENYLKYVEGSHIKMKRTSPLSVDYRPELDQSPELSPKDAAYYQSFIGILRWKVELGRVDICCEGSTVSSYLAMPSDGHLQQVFHTFSYLGSKHNARMVFDPRYPNLDYSKFEKRDWSSFYGEVKEEIPDNILTAHRSEFIILCFCDSDHAGDQLTRRSQTGFTVYLNSAPIYWFFKK